ncbi:T9SS-dependent choice-of-anchor J family protein [Flavobacterium silvaticum]|uniref:T9SS type A sorting domain-containing protein n=1 Tax=Flavobacterium silvaticum TaxID=1852020 RepID=A0A972JFN2_9FLAO|nr:T9SS type A sorting domain-containing protein [Flavobacterium silvaticum]NMH27356.1 T9SS type A sorting domain-containing protein [Flavobacterium silvaticum]
MRKITFLIFTILFGLCFQISIAQTTILDQSLLTEGSFNTFSPVSVTGTQGWYFSSQYGAVCNGYAGGQSFSNEDWLVSESIDLSQADNVLLTFSHTRGSASVLNVGVSQGWYKVFATAAYTGDPASTTWVEVTGMNQSVPSAWQYISSGELTIPEAAKSAATRIAFRYISSNTQSATWEIKNVKVTGDLQGINSFKVTNWNTEWLGCTQFGPDDEGQQMENVASAMISMNSDVYCLQEITGSQSTINTLVSLLGDGWAGNIVPVNTENCDQRQAIIYKTSKVQFVSSSQLSSGNSAQGNSYSYNWTNGRFPAVYNLNLINGTSNIPVTIINIHAKAEDGEAMSYTRRLGASQALKTILDGSNYNSKNLILIGDFNDYLIGTSSNACSCTDSPYKNFIDDEADYKGITKDLINVNSGNPVIENFIISNELFANYVTQNAAQEINVANSISNYYNTTSDHLPVSATFQFSTLGTTEFVQTDSKLKIYPNPVKTELRLYSGQFKSNATIYIYDLTGKLVLHDKTSAETINVSSLPSGLYLLKLGDKTARFIKE